MGSLHSHKTPPELNLKGFFRLNPTIAQESAKELRNKISDNYYLKYILRIFELVKNQ